MGRIVDNLVGLAGVLGEIIPQLARLDQLSASLDLFGSRDIRTTNEGNAPGVVLGTSVGSSGSGGGGGGGGGGGRDFAIGFATSPNALRPGNPGPGVAVAQASRERQAIVGELQGLRRDLALGGARTRAGGGL